MTYCLAIKINDGLVFASDSRTNAGLDNISTYSKMFTFNVGDRAFVILTSGNPVSYTHLTLPTTVFV